MKYVIVILLFLVTFQSSAQGDLGLYKKREYVSRQGKVMPYRILYPQGYNPSVQYPVVLFLHGSGERGNDNESQLKHGSGVFLKEENRKKFPCFVIFPQCPKDDFWSSVKIDGSVTPANFEFDYAFPEKDALTSAMEILQKVMEEESIDKGRIYIEGISMGAMGVYEAIYHHPDIFSAAVAICGGGDINLYDKSVKDIYFWIFHGDQDESVPVKYSRDMVEKLKSLRAQVRYTEYVGGKHDSWNNAFANQDFVSTIFAQKRKFKY